MKSNVFLRGIAVAAVSVLLLPPVFGQDTETPGLKDQIEDLKKGQAEISKQLEEIKKLIAARPAAPAPAAGPNVADVVFDLGANPVKGEQVAKLTLVEFTDYQ